MKQKYIRFIVVLVVLFQMFMLSISQVHAQNNNTKKQPEVCAWPSETMQQYFQFQKDALAAIVSFNASNGKSSLWNSDWWLFVNKDLNLPSSALDYVVGNVFWKWSSIVSTASTSVVLLMLASSSVVQSDVEWFAIFFKDRPIVRDYKQMLDIETEIFDTAFTLSRKVNLTRSLEWNTVSQFNAVVDKYKASWLLRNGGSTNNASMANMLLDLISMNASMKYFISVWWEVWASELRSYAWCMWLYKSKECNSSNFILWFSDEAVSKLEEDYSGSWWYWACNSYASNFKNSLSKSAKNNWDSIKNAWNDMKVSWKNLINTLIWQWKKSKELTDPCKMTDYERAQLDAYYWWDRSCGEWNSAAELLAGIKEFDQNKKTLAEQWGETDDLSKKSSSSQPPSFLNVMDELDMQNRTPIKSLVWYRMYSGESRYNSEFSRGMNEEFTMVFNDISEQFGHSQRAAMASDLSYELSKFKWLVDQVGAAMKEAKQLEKDLQDIADYQCSM